MTSPTTQDASLPLRSSAGKVPLQPLFQRPFSIFSTGALHFFVTKWCVPGGLEESSGCRSSSEGGARAFYPWSSATSTSCGGDTLGLDCFFIFLTRMFFVSMEVLSSNIKFFRTSLVKGLLVFCTSYVLCEWTPPRSSRHLLWSKKNLTCMIHRLHWLYSNHNIDSGPSSSRTPVLTLCGRFSN
jgi:hypothetical protein